MPRRPHGDTQQIILQYIKDYTEENGYAPSVREIGEAVGLKSTSTVHGHLTRLEKKGLLHRAAMKPRTIDLNSNRSRREDMQSIPIVGNVAAGSPILAEEDIQDYITLPGELLGDGENFVLSVHGESMINAGIMNGDFIVVQRQATAQNGEIVVALIDDEATVKRFFKEPGRIRLQPENSSMQPMYFDNVQIVGKVKAVYRTLR